MKNFIRNNYLRLMQNRSGIISTAKSEASDFVTTSAHGFVKKYLLMANLMFAGIGLIIGFILGCFVGALIA